MGRLPSNFLSIVSYLQWQGWPDAASGSTAHMLRLLRQQAGLPAAALGRWALSSATRLPAAAETAAMGAIKKARGSAGAACAS